MFFCLHFDVSVGVILLTEAISISSTSERTRNTKRKSQEERKNIYLLKPEVDAIVVVDGASEVSFFYVMFFFTIKM